MLFKAQPDSPEVSLSWDRACRRGGVTGCAWLCLPGAEGAGPACAVRPTTEGHRDLLPPRLQPLPGRPQTPWATW